jgi:hypothetical protein
MAFSLFMLQAARQANFRQSQRWCHRMRWTGHYQSIENVTKRDKGSTVMNMGIIHSPHWRHLR